jgi:hypothetical protein
MFAENAPDEVVSSPWGLVRFSHFATICPQKLNNFTVEVAEQL